MTGLILILNDAFLNIISLFIPNDDDATGETEGIEIVTYIHCDFIN